MKKFRIAGPLWGLALVSLGLAACATPNLRVLENPQAKNAPTAHQRVFEAAFVAQGAGKLDRATNLWREYLNQEPKDYAAHNNLGLVYYTQDRLPESIAHFESALKLSPANQTVKSNLTRSLQFQTSLFKENKEYERAMGHLKRLQTLAPREDFQKLQFMVEEVEDRIYEQV
ncbi:MAG: tetratricopeptide repeat protein, partial [Nitrospinaceae bacterium]